MDRGGEVGGVRGVETILFLVVLGSQPTRLLLQHGLDLEAARLSDEHH
jgi:hypothetical protein